MCLRLCCSVLNDSILRQANNDNCNLYSNSNNNNNDDGDGIGGDDESITVYINNNLKIT